MINIPDPSLLAVNRNLSEEQIQALEDICLYIKQKLPAEINIVYTSQFRIEITRRKIDDN